MGRARLSTLEADETGDRPGGERRAAAAVSGSVRAQTRRKAVDSAAEPGMGRDVRPIGSRLRCRPRVRAALGIDVRPLLYDRDEGFPKQGGGTMASEAKWITEWMSTPHPVDSPGHDSGPPLVADAHWWMLCVGAKRRTELAFAA